MWLPEWPINLLVVLLVVVSLGAFMWALREAYLQTKRVIQEKSSNKASFVLSNELEKELLKAAERQDISLELVVSDALRSHVSKVVIYNMNLPRTIDEEFQVIAKRRGISIEQVFQEALRWFLTSDAIDQDRNSRLMFEALGEMPTEVRLDPEV